MKRDHTLRFRLPLDQYFTNTTKMLENWSKDRTKDKIFQHEVVITNELLEIAYNWIWHYKCCVYKMSDKDVYLVCKEKYQNNLVIFEKLLSFNQCDLDFNSLDDLIKIVSLII